MAAGERSPFLSARAPVCPPELIARARALARPRVAIARAGALLPMSAAMQATEAGIMEPVFVGEPEDIMRIAERLGWDIAPFRLVGSRGAAEAGFEAAALCGRGEADILMKGHIHSDLFLKSVMRRDAGLRTRQRLVHVFHISPPDGGRPLLVSDAAVNVAPRIRTRQAATRAVVELLHRLGVECPEVAFLSATETPIASIPSSIEARALRNWAREAIEGARFAGPLALDLILSADSAASKGMEDEPMVGRADAIMVPDIVTGNAVFKALVYLSGGCAAGIVLGAKVPLLLTSRADPPAARLASVALAVVASGVGAD